MLEQIFFILFVIVVVALWESKFGLAATRRRVRRFREALARSRDPHRSDKD